MRIAAPTERPRQVRAACPFCPTLEFWFHHRHLPAEARDLANRRFATLQADPRHPSRRGAEYPVTRIDFEAFGEAQGFNLRSEWEWSPVNLNGGAGGRWI